MAEQPDIQAIKRQLFSQPALTVYAVLDGASVLDLLESLWTREPESCCLLPGELSPDLAAMAPYLVRLAPEDAFTDWVLERGWGEHWGVFAGGAVGLREMRCHLRELLTVYDPDGKTMYFRFYDPRVLRAFLPTCKPDEAGELFGPVVFYAMEGATPDTMLLGVTDGASVRVQSVPLSV